MKKLHYSIQINAPREKVWDIMLGEQTYPQWTSEFSEGSHYEGSWETDSKILFVAPDENGKKSGMLSRIAENRPHEYLSIQHLGIINDGIEDTTSQEAKKWNGEAYENYTFQEVNGSTQLLIDMDSDDEYVEMFERLWPKALQKLKELAEK